MEVIDLGAPIDVLWMRLPRRPDDSNETLGRVRSGKILVTLNRGDYWQCAYVIAKGAFDDIRRKGLPRFQEDIAAAAPFLRGRVKELKDWNEIKLLSVAVDRLRQWSRAGLLCIGDSAHAMSPIGGVGINLAIQDAVAAANILVRPLLSGALDGKCLQDVQRRREFPTRMTQGFQVFAHKHVLRPVLRQRNRISTPAIAFQALATIPGVTPHSSAHAGNGFRPEHVRTPDVT